MVLLQGGISAIRRIWKYVSIIGTVVVVSPFMTQHVRAFQNEYTIHSDAEGFGLSITDVTTGITNLRTLFIHEEHSVTVKGIEWRTITPSDNNNSNNNNNNTTMQPTNRPEEELLWWSTVVDGTVVATGNISLNDHGRLLPTHFDAGTFTVSSNRKHYVQVILQLNNGNVNDDDPTSKFIVSDTYVAYRPGVSIIPMIFVLVMAMSTHMVRIIDAYRSKRCLCIWVPTTTSVCRIRDSPIVHCFTMVQVEVSLFSCIFVGACIVAGNVWDGFKDSLAVYLVGAMYDKDHVFVILFTLFLSGLVGMMEKSGGMIGFTKFVSRLAKTQRRGQYSVFITSCMIFFDDYANIMLTGETMKPLTDLLMVSREKLAFIVDATAGPISSLSPISSWVEIGLIIKEVNKLKVKFGADHLTITTSGLGTFLQSLKYCYYPIFMIFLLFCIIGFQRDFGPMLIAERKVFISQRTDGGNGKGKQVTSTTEQKVNQPRADAPYYAFNMLIPVVVLVRASSNFS
jgi:Na+/H+ antiporter NhaC